MNLNPYFSKEYNLQPLARFVGFSVASLSPEVIGIGPKEAIPKALEQIGITQDQLDWVELNEVFTGMGDLIPYPSFSLTLCYQS
jgi:acetyl-CoA acyltransferase